MRYTVEHGDCIEVMAAMDEASIDAIVTDPPYAQPVEQSLFGDAA